VAFEKDLAVKTATTLTQSTDADSIKAKFEIQVFSNLRRQVFSVSLRLQSPGWQRDWPSRILLHILLISSEAPEVKISSEAPEVKSLASLVSLAANVSQNSLEFLGLSISW